MALEETVGPHSCKNCYAINPEFTEISYERKVCAECGGTVLSFLELVDTLADRDSEIRDLREDLHESWESDERKEDEHLDDE